MLGRVWGARANQSGIEVDAVEDSCGLTRGGRMRAGDENRTRFSAWEADVLPLNYARGRPPHYPLPAL